eukprot:TRINITY_DN708_c0_g1_i1.p1 TRINITY_DN708_c0_g1~~TRINITY_DN708_c0_g1_i1.p1  ORF type:complete len:165 (-),score=29.86 TRINITY_DN708_c0_g1_i1:128-622(-)
MVTCTSLSALSVNVAVVSCAKESATVSNGSFLPSLAIRKRLVSTNKLQLGVARKRSLVVVNAETQQDPSQKAQEIFDTLKTKWDAVENKSQVVIYAGGAVVVLWFSSALVSSINSVPLLPKILELVGLGYSGWFVYRYLLLKERREELKGEIEELKKKITGTTE